MSETIATPSSGNPHLTSLVKRALEGHHGDRIKRSALYYTTAAGLYAVGKAIWNEARARFEYIITIDDLDEVYFELHQWLFKNVPQSKLRNLTAYSVTVRGIEDEDAAEVRALESRRDDDGSGWAMAQPDSSASGPKGKIEERRTLKLRYADSRTIKITLDGQKIEVTVNERDFNSGKAAQNISLAAKEYVEFRCMNKAGRDAVIKFLRELANKVKERKPRLVIAGNYGWEYTDLPPRSMDTVIFPAEERERLVDDLALFFADEQFYIDTGMPYHRGYLLYGPPGTGKTSFARALATHFGMDVYYIPLSSLKSDVDLIVLINNVKPGAMLLLEDIDVVHGAKERDDTERGVSLSALLNALDGVITPHGLITVMTTNDRDVIDPALLREGRSDVEVEVGFLDEEQYGRVVALVSPELKDLPPLGTKQVTPAAVLEALKSARKKSHAGQRRALEKVIRDA